MPWLFVTLDLAATILCGLMAGLFFAFSIAVMGGLGRLPAEHGMAAMRHINAAILNPVFLMIFLATAVVCGAELLLSPMRWAEPGAGLRAAGAAAYFVGAFVVTMTINVPLNNALMAAPPTETDVWRQYLGRWTAWNHLRTVTSLAALILFALALGR